MNTANFHKLIHLKKEIMKKLNLTFSSLFGASIIGGSMLFSLAGYSQAVEEQIPYSPAQIVDLNQPAFYKWHSANAIKKDATSGMRDVVSYISIGTAYNLYTILLSEQSQVSYDPDINSISFVHRQNSGTTGGSGGLSYDLSTDGGVSWVTNNILTPAYNSGTELPDVSGARYPSAALWNPEGNTDPNNAYIVAHGPELTPVTAGSWGATFKLTERLDGANSSEVYYSEDDASGDYHAYGIQAYASGSLWDAKTNLFGSPLWVNEATFNGVDGFDWNTTVVTFDWYASQTKAQVVFDPSGTIGYVVVLGALLDAPEYNMYPTILKTTDAGATWDFLPYYNLGTLPAMESTLLAADDGVTRRPYFSDFDACVDGDGRLHIFSDVESGFYVDPASIFSIYGSFSAMMHCSVSDGTDWTAEALASTSQSDYVFGAVLLDHSPQISRTPDGSKIFFTWTMSPELNISHDSPNLMAKGYDAVTGNYTETVDYSTGTDFENNIWYPTTAPVSKDLGGTYEIPVVFADPGVSDLVAPQFYYAMGVTFSDEDFNNCNPVAPDGIFADDITATSATINWSAVTGADAYKGAIWNLSTGVIHKFSAGGDATSFALTYGLTPSTTYGVRLKTACLDYGIFSDYSEFAYFTTSPLRMGEQQAVAEIYPNPNSGNFTVNLTGYNNVETTIQVVNAVGQIVYSEIVVPVNDLTAKQIALNVPSGMYQVKILSNNQVNSYGIIIE